MSTLGNTPRAEDTPTSHACTNVSSLAYEPHLSISHYTMVYHPDLDLHKPLDREVPATIRRSPLRPRLALSALTLHGDFYRQLQSKTNARIFWHPATQIFMVLVLAATVVYQFYDLWVVLDTWAEFGDLVLHNKYLVTAVFPSLIFVAGTVGLTSFLLTDEIREISDKLGGDAYQQRLFLFPLKVYANSSPKDLDNKASADFLESASASTELIEYRESPIAVVTVVPLSEKSTKDTFYAQITGFHVRKAYKEAGLQNDLLDIAVEKTRALAAAYVKKNKLKKKAPRTVLLCDAYSVDELNRPVLEKRGFELKLATTQLDPFAEGEVNGEKFLSLIPDSVVKRFFGVYRQTYELELDHDGTVEASGAEVSASTVKSRKG